MRVLLWVLPLFGFSFCALAGGLIQATGLWALDGDTFVVDVSGERTVVRLLGVDAPERGACLGREAKEEAQGLISRTIWLEPDPEKGLKRRDRDGRLLAHIFLEPQRSADTCLAVLLVRQGLAKLDIRGARDSWPLDRFDIRYAPWVISAQVEAALKGQGWWGRCDPFAGSDMAIAAIKYWGQDEVVYIVNRGESPVDLAAGWELTSDPPWNQTLSFGHFVRQLPLPPGWILRIHTGPAVGEKTGDYRMGEGTIDYFWTARKIWRNEGDEARLLFDRESVYVFRYPSDE